MNVRSVYSSLTSALLVLRVRGQFKVLSIDRREVLTRSKHSSIKLLSHSGVAEDQSVDLVQREGAGVSEQGPAPCN